MQQKLRFKRLITHFCYVETGQTFYSKEEVIWYFNMGNASGVASQPTTPTAVKSKEASEGLPEGWITKIKVRKKGIVKKYYVDPATGRRFYTKPQVSRYLAILNNAADEQDKIGTSSDKNPTTEHSNGGSSKQDVSQNSEIVNSGSRKGWKRKDGVGKKLNRVVTERAPADGLPPGWIKEVRVRIKKTHIVNKKDPYFIDPTSGYIFRSMLDALRFVETGDIDKCAMKPRKGKAHELEFLNVGTSSPSAVDTKGSTDNTTERKLSGDENPKSGVENSAEAPEAENPEVNHSLDNKSEGKEVSEPKTTPEAENPEENHPIDNKSEPKTAPEEPEDENPEEHHSIDNKSKAKKVSEPKSKVSKRKRATKVPAENITLEEEKSPKKTKKENITVTSPGRSSKRLSGVKPEMTINLGLNERALRAAAKKDGKTNERILAN